ncbi:uncharacterized protein LOC135473923 [Liolophura sinensis]|uniref:uncharacterized protein LOC135473923 n=1 Tax=Liolophura sinensis TaxID=3198878 RepID=UPI0031583921
MKTTDPNIDRKVDTKAGLVNLASWQTTDAWLQRMGNQNSAQSSSKICPRDVSINACPRDLGSTNQEVKECAKTTKNLSTCDQYRESCCLAVEEADFMYMPCPSFVAACDIDLHFQILFERGIWSSGPLDRNSLTVNDTMLCRAEERREGLSQKT